MSEDKVTENLKLDSEPGSFEAELDPEMELNALVRAIELANHGWIFLVCDPRDQESVSSKIKEKIRDEYHIDELKLSGPIDNLLDEVRAQKNRFHSDGALFIFGLEKSLEGENGQMLSSLNFTVDTLIREVGRPVVCWVPSEDLLGEYSKGAPDFFSRRSGSYTYSSEN